MPNPIKWEEIEEVEEVGEPIFQFSQALEVIENVRKISSPVWVNQNQCQRLAERFTLIAEGLKVMGLDKNFPCAKALDGGGSCKDYPGFDELLTVLRKGEALVSSYGKYGVWKAITSAVSRTDNREAFLEIHEELDTLNSQFHFEGFNGEYDELESRGVERSELLTEDPEADLEELPKNVEILACTDEEQASNRVSNLDLKPLQQVVTEKIKPIGEDGHLPSYLNIGLAEIELKAPICELVRQSKDDPTDKDGWTVVYDGSWLGCEFAIKVFKSGDQSEWNKEQLLKEVGALVELRHPHVIGLVGFGQDSEKSFFLMEKMDADLRNFMKRKLEPAPRPKPRPFNRSEELDIIAQIAKGVYYLHTQQYVHRELNCTNILVKDFGGYLEVKIADLRNAMKLGGEWDQEAFETACSTRRPRWTAPEAIEKFGGSRPSSDSLVKSDVYSFAMTCYEVVTGKYPFDGIKDDALLEQIMAGKRPELPGELDDDLKGVITLCWDSDPNKRPNFESICHVLDYIRSKQSTVGIKKSSGKDLVLRLFKQVPQVHGHLVGLVGQVRKNANPPAPESSSWDDQNKGRDLQRSNSTICCAEHLRIEPTDLKKLRLIGIGASAKVYETTWLGCKFAVKKFRSQNLDISGLIELKLLISLRHPYVAQLVGLSIEDQNCMIVMELMSSDLRELIEYRQRKWRKRDTTSENVQPFDLHEAVPIIYKIALGMAFLHSRGVMHRDLNSSNVLVQEHPGHIDVKIVDFGLSRYLTKSETHGDYIGVGTGFWRAPEILSTETADRSSKPNLMAIDVYAFAMTSYEVVTGRLPCSDLEEGDYDLVIGGYRPTLPSDLHPGLKALIEQCWHGDPEQRPKFTDICEELRMIQQICSVTNFSNCAENFDLHEARIFSSRESTFKLFHSALDAQKTVVGGDGEVESERKILRTCNWSAEEIRTMLEFTEEALSVDDVPIWDYVSENLWDKCGFDRASISCESMWDALLHSYKATQDDESKSRAGTYLDLECREIFERILASKSFEEKTRTGRLEDNMSLFGVGDEVLRDDLKDDDICSSEYQGLSGDTTGTIESRAEVTMDCHVSPITETRYETNANYAGRRMSPATAMEDELITRMAPFVNKQIEDALKPLISVLQGRENDLKNRQKSLVLEEEKLALKRQKMLSTHRGTTF